jgi:hypothetical protein
MAGPDTPSHHDLAQGRLSRSIAGQLKLTSERVALLENWAAGKPSSRCGSVVCSRLVRDTGFGFPESQKAERSD